MRKIEIKRSEVAQLKGLGYKTVDISRKYGITLEETVDMLKEFKMYNSKTSGKTKDYEVYLVDDITTTTNATTNVPTAELTLN